MTAFWWGAMLSGFVWVPVGFVLFAMLTINSGGPVTIREGSEK